MKEEIKKQVISKNSRKDIIKDLKEQVKLQEKLLKTQEQISNSYLKISLNDKDKIIALLEEQKAIMVPLIKPLQPQISKYRNYIG